MINYTDMTKEESKRLCIKIDVLKEKLAILQKAWDKSPESVPLAEIDRCKAELRELSPEDEAWLDAVVSNF